MPFSVTQVGHLTEQKQVRVTIDAFRLLKKLHPQARLALIGEGPEREALEERVRQYGLSEDVCFTGQIKNADALAKMGETQFFVMPSVHEGFGIVYLEAMASGCITIGTQGEGIADVIVSGENGFLVPPADPESIVNVMEWCFANPEETLTIAERGRQTAKMLTWDKNAAQYIALYQLLIERNSRNERAIYDVETK